MKDDHSLCFIGGAKSYDNKRYLIAILKTLLYIFYYCLKPLNNSFNMNSLWYCI